MCAKKYYHDTEEETVNKKENAKGPRRVVYDHVKGGFMFDTYQSIKDLEKEGKFSEKQAAAIVKVISRNNEQSIANLATKQDIELLQSANKQDMELLRSTTKQDIGLLKQDIDGVKKDLCHLEEKMNLRFESIDARMATKEDLAKVHSSLITWLMGISVTIGGALIVGLYYIIKYLPAIQPVIQNTPS